MEEVQLPDGDLGDVLPVVGDLPPSNVSAFSLMEESGPSLPQMELSVPIESLHTLEVLA